MSGVTFRSFSSPAQISTHGTFRCHVFTAGSLILSFIAFTHLPQRNSVTHYLYAEGDTWAREEGPEYSRRMHDDKLHDLFSLQDYL